MSRPRKPSHLHAIEGTRVRQDRSGESALFGELGPLGAPPDHLSDAELAAWRDIVSAVPEGVLLSPDCIIVECAARLLARCRGGDARAGDFGNLLRSLSACGLTPTDRAKLGPVPVQPKADDPWARLEAKD